MTQHEKLFLKICEDIKSKLTPISTEHKKIRIGDTRDGGYVCLDLKNYDCLYSLGSDDNIIFEKGFFSKYKKECYVYDHTIDKITNKPDYIHFFKKGVGQKKTDVLETFDNLIIQNNHENFKNMMAQIDIEGYEWLILNNTKFIENFSQIIIEYHIPHNITDVYNIILSTLDNMNDKFYIVHIHGNNCPLSPWFDINLPRVFEVTYVRKDLVNNVCNETTPYPTEYDSPNDLSRPDMTLNWWLLKNNNPITKNE